MVDRPLKERAGARILVRAGEQILLVQRHDPGIAGSSWWTLPGGGIDVGETSREAAARELLEETGIIVAPSDLRGPVATRTVTHGYSDRILRQVEEFFVAEIASPQKVRPLMWTAREEETMGEARWMTLDDVDALTDPVWEEPRRLLAALTSENQPLKMAPVELSTVPVEA